LSALRKSGYRFCGHNALKLLNLEHDSTIGRFRLIASCSTETRQSRQSSKGMTANQPDLFAAPGPQAPEGLAYRPGFLSPDEEDGLAAHLAGLPFQPFQFHGFEGARRVVSFGWRYDFNQGGLQRAEPMPEWLAPLAVRAAAFAGLAPEAVAHVLVTEYAPGAGIGWHRDRPQFEDVIGVSLLSPCRLRFRLREGAGWRRAALEVAPRSAYLLRGPARRAWEHSIAPMRTLRYAITFRSFRAGVGDGLEKSSTPSRSGENLRPARSAR
jgi:alkylated DNA repair dioxygenase AlkB